MKAKPLILYFPVTVEQVKSPTAEPKAKRHRNSIDSFDSCYVRKIIEETPMGQAILEYYEQN